MSVLVQGKKTNVPAQAGQVGSKGGEFLLPLPFCSIQALNGLGDANPHWGGPSTESTDSTADLI